MTSYTTIANADVDANSPITTSLMTALRDNPTAITEGSSGAPLIQQAALDENVVGGYQLKGGLAGGDTTWLVGAGNYYLVPWGHYFVNTPTTLSIDIYRGSSWRGGSTDFGGGFLWSDGSSIRLVNDTGGAVTVQVKQVTA